MIEVGNLSPAVWILGGVGALFVAFVLNTILLALLRRHDKGAFFVLRDDRHAFRFKTDFGTFTLDRTNGLLRSDALGEFDEIPMEQVERFDFAFRAESATWNSWIRGLNVWGVLKEYEDLIQWHRISLVCPDGTFPLFEVGQYLPREPLMTRMFDLQANILRRLNRFDDSDDRARDVLAQLQRAFSASGYPITLTPGWVRARQEASEHPTATA